MRTALPVALAFALAALGAPGTAAGQPAPGPVLVIGDSLEGGTAPNLRAELGDLPVTVDQRTGRSSAGGVRALAARLRPQHRAVVFDLGVNDDPRNPSALAASLNAARELVGDRCMVVATVQRPPLGGVTVAGLNAAVRHFVADTPGAQLVDWQRAVRAQRGLVIRDGVHGTAEGYALRASLVADAIAGCLVPDAEPAPARHPKRRRKPRPSLELPRLDRSLFAALEAAVRDIGDLLASAGRHLREAAGMDVPEPVLGASSAKE